MDAEKEVQTVVVICPKCKVRLKVGDDKIAPQGTRFKCPKCSTVLMVKKPAVGVRPLDKSKVLVAHEDAVVSEKLRRVLIARGYEVLSAKDGIQAMVTATKELPFAAILGVSIPKIYGFEVCKRLKTRPETKDIKIILMASVYDMRKYRREPQSLHDADDYIEEHQIEELLAGKMESLKGIDGGRPLEKPKEAEKSIAETAGAKKDAHEKPAVYVGVPGEPPREKRPAVTDDPVERAKRLARTIIADIYLYSKAKVDDSIRNNTFQKTFASELREGIKLYENRVPADVRSQGDFFNEAISNFIEKRKQEIVKYS